MMKLNKDTFEVEFVDTLTCFCGGGSDAVSYTHLTLPTNRDV